jgi:hypothetical protein
MSGENRCWIDANVYFRASRHSAHSVESSYFIVILNCGVGVLNGAENRFLPRYSPNAPQCLTIILHRDCFLRLPPRVAKIF